MESKRKSTIQWDEAVIAEHDKERGTRQKIEEPPTPYRYSSDSDTSDVESSKDTTSRSASRHKLREADSKDVSCSWEALNAQLCYHKDIEDKRDMYRDNNIIPLNDFGEITAMDVDNERQTTRMSPSSSESKGSVYHGDREAIRATTVVPSAPVEEARNRSKWGLKPPNPMAPPCPSSSRNVSAIPSPRVIAAVMERDDNSTGFKKKRAAHYNEYQVIQAMKMKLKGGLHSDDEDD